jgi:carboxyl-terminal processing protease
MKKIPLRINFFIIFVFLFIFGFVSEGKALSGFDQPSRKRSFQIKKGVGIIEETYNLITHDYVDPISPYRLLNETSKGFDKIVEGLKLIEETDSGIVIELGSKENFTQNVTSEKALRKIIQIYRYVSKIKPDLNPLDLAFGPLNDMVKSLDPHSVLLPPEAFKELKVGTKGEFGGIGIVVTMRDEILKVISPIEGTPAYRAGIRSGDTIIKVDDFDIKGLQLWEAVRKMRGKKGTKVTLTIMREGALEPLLFHIYRDIIPIESVKYKILEQNFVYIRITNFQQNTLNDLEDALNNIESKTYPINGLILDLRDNPGGLLNQSVKVADLFLEKEIIVSIKGRLNRNNKTFNAKKQNSDRNFPLITLINEGSASASEIVAGALGDQKRSLIIGKKSYGKGSVQTVEKLPAGYGLKFTIARYYTPTGKSIQDEGVIPDIILTREKIDLSTEESGEDIEDISKRYGSLSVTNLLSDLCIQRALKIFKKSRSGNVAEMLISDKEINREEQEKLIAKKKMPDNQTMDSNQAAASLPSSSFKPRLFLLSIGVSRYIDNRFNLKYAKNDALAIADVFAIQSNNIFSEVRTKILTDEEVTRESILNTVSSFLGRAISTDLVIIFVAGHGVKRSSTGTYYFLPYSASYKTLTTEALRWSDFEEEVKHLSKRVKNVVLILDTCHSGALKIGMRGIQLSGDLSSPFQKQGLYVIAAARSDEGAFEKDSWEHGALTLAILNGLKGDADFDQNHQIDVLELFHFVESQVADMTNGYQHPHFQMGGGTLPLFAIP